MAQSPLTDALRETLARFDGAGTPLTTTEVADALDLGRRSTYERLERLVDQGVLATKKAGANGRVWWRPADAGDSSAAATTPVGDALEGVDVGMIVLDDGLDVAWINETAEGYFGLDGDRVVGRDGRTLVREGIAPTVENPTPFAETVLGSGDAATGRFECRVTASEDRESRLLEHRSESVDDGAFAGGRVELFYDVTDRAGSERGLADDGREFQSAVDAADEYERRLRAEEAFTGSLLDSQRDVIYALDAEGRLLRWNDRFETVTGYSAERIEGANAVEFVSETDAEAVCRAIRRVIDEGEHVAIDLRLETREGREIPYEFIGSPLRDESGEITGVAGVGRDIGDRKATERRLQRQRADLERELEDVFDRISHGFYGLDEQMRFTYLNDSARDVLGVTETGRDIRTVLDLTDNFEAALERAAAEQEPVIREDYYEPADAWFENAIYPSESGLSVYFRDVTERKRRERDLRRTERRFEAVFEDPNILVALLEPDGTVVDINGTAMEYVDAGADAVTGVPFWETPWWGEGDDAEHDVREWVERAADGEYVDFEADLVRPNGDRYAIDGFFRPVTNEDGDVVSIIVSDRDVSERREYRRTLEEYRRRYRTLVENFPNGAVALVDRDYRYVTVGGTPTVGEELSREDLEGERVHDALPPEQRDFFISKYKDTLDGEASRFERTIGDQVYRFQFVPIRDADGTVTAAMATAQEITELKRQERELREAKAQLEAATVASKVGTWEWHVDEDRIVTGPWFAEMFGIDPEAARRGMPLDAVLPAIHEEDRADVEEGIERAVATCGEYEEEYRVRNEDGELRWVVARGRVECDEDGDPVSFPGAVTDITKRKRAELELERQRERLAALNHLSDVVRNITDAVIDQSTREEIERVVCEALAGIDSYEFAWVGEVDMEGGTIIPRAEAGVDGYLEEIPQSVDPSEPAGRGLSGRAVRTMETHVTGDVMSDPSQVPWREAAAEYGYRSVAIIPIVHDETMYGLLGVYADRLDAFAGKEGTVVSQLGEIVGHAIAAADRKRALMSDEAVELEFQVRDLFDSIGVDASPSGTTTIEHAVPIGGDEYLLYGTATPDAVETVETLAETDPHWADVTFRDEGRTVGFEVRLSETPVLSKITGVGGSIEEAVIEDGDYRMTFHVAPGTGVRQLIDAVQSAYPGAEMLKRRQVTRRHGAAERVRNVLTEGLTDRQRSALQAAFHAGFFEWPRDASGEEVAASLGVAAPTFHQHLRKAERAVFESLLSDPPSA